MRWRQKSAEEPHRAPVSVQEVREQGPSACSLGPMPSDTVIIVSESAPRVDQVENKKMITTKTPSFLGGVSSRWRRLCLAGSHVRDRKGQSGTCRLSLGGRRAQDSLPLHVRC
jgi:hypothetical protein